MKHFLAAAFFLLGLNVYAQTPAQPAAIPTPASVIAAQKQVDQQVEDLQFNAAFNALVQQSKEMVTSSQSLSATQKNALLAKVNDLSKNSESVKEQLKIVINHIQRLNGDYIWAALGAGFDFEYGPGILKVKNLGIGPELEISVGGLVSLNRNDNLHDTFTSSRTATFTQYGIRALLAGTKRSYRNLLPEVGLTFKVLFAPRGTSTNFTDLNGVYYGIGLEKDISALNHAIGSFTVHILGSYSNIPDLNNPTADEVTVMNRLKQLPTDLMPRKILASIDVDFGKRTGAPVNTTRTDGSAVQDTSKNFLQIERQVFSTHNDNLGQGETYFENLKRFMGFKQ